MAPLRVAAGDSHPVLAALEPGAQRGVKTLPHEDRANCTIVGP